MNEIRIEKTVRRKIAETALFFWGVFGMAICLFMAHQAFQFDMQARIAQTAFGSPIPAVVMYTLVWIGGLVFLGFFALFAPIKMVLGPSQDHS